MYTPGNGSELKRADVISLFVKREFTTDQLKQLAARLKIKNRSKLHKEDLATLVRDRIANQDAAFELLVDRFLPDSAPKRWLVVFTRGPDDPFDLDNLPEAGPYASFLDKFAPGEDYFGPIRKDGRIFYLITIPRPWRVSGGTTVQGMGRWTVVAMVNENHLTFHWRNCEGAPKPSEAPRYERYVHPALLRFAEHLGDGWIVPDLKGLILEDVWDKYRDGEKNTTHDMTDTYVYVQERGMSLRVSTRKKDLGGDKSDEEEDPADDVMDYKRLTDITDKLADKALDQIGVKLSREQRRAARAAVLRTFIREWDTRQYECMITDNAAAQAAQLAELTPRSKRGKGKKVKHPGLLFMGKTFFGTEAVGEGVFAHIRCHPENGNSWGAAKFLLEELGVW